MFGALYISQHFYQGLQGQKFVRLLIGIYLLTQEYYQQPIKQSKVQKDIKTFNKMLNLKRNYDQKPKENLYMSKKYVPLQDKEQQNYLHKQSKPLKRQLLTREIKNLQDQRKDIQLTVQEESCQLHRYLKEYQYNTYQPHQTQHEQNDQNKYIANMDLQGRYSSKYSSSNASHIDSRYIKNNQNKENVTNNYEFSFIGPNHNSNMKGKRSQKNNQALIKSTEKQLFISKQEIVLLKHLREQNNQLKLEISKKNTYIQELQEKLQRYLKDRIQSEKQADKLCKSLQNRLLNAQNHIKNLQNEIKKYKESENQHEKSLRFIFKAININPSGDISYEQLPKMTKLLQQILQQKNTFNEFIHKIEEMRTKIESKSNKNQSTLGKSHYDSKNNSNRVNKNKPVNLKQLWKWLKLVAKQYEVMKEKVSLIQKEQFISKN